MPYWPTGTLLIEPDIDTLVIEDELNIAPLFQPGATTLDHVSSLEPTSETALEIAAAELFSDYEIHDGAVTDIDYLLDAAGSVPTISKPVQLDLFDDVPTHDSAAPATLGTPEGGIVTIIVDDGISENFVA